MIPQFEGSGFGSPLYVIQIQHLRAFYIIVLGISAPPLFGWRHLRLKNVPYLISMEEWVNSMSGIVAGIWVALLLRLVFGFSCTRASRSSPSESKVEVMLEAVALEVKLEAGVSALTSIVFRLSARRFNTPRLLVTSACTKTRPVNIKFKKNKTG